MIGLFDEGAAALAAVEAFIKRSEDRLAYRRERGRDLSKAHQRQLRELGERLDVMRERLAALLGPDPEELLAQFRDLEEKLDRLEVHDGAK